MPEPFTGESQSELVFLPFSTNTPTRPPAVILDPRAWYNDNYVSSEPNKREPLGACVRAIDPPVPAEPEPILRSVRTRSPVFFGTKRRQHI